MGRKIQGFKVKVSALPHLPLPVHILGKIFPVSASGQAMPCKKKSEDYADYGCSNLNEDHMEVIK